MSLIQWEPNTGLDRLFEEKYWFPFAKGVADLQLDLFKENNSLVAKMSIPGVRADDIDVTLDKEYLTISGIRNEEHKVEEKDYFTKEIRHGSFTRTVRLPLKVDTKKAGASYKGGVLVVKVPILDSGQEKAVQVEVAEED